jgi:hypothetical protein
MNWYHADLPSRNCCPSGITFNAYAFSEPRRLSGFPCPPSGFFDPSGIYAILVSDPYGAPRPYRPVYFGESKNIYERAGSGHENFPAWQREAGLGRELYVVSYHMPYSTQRTRQLIESELITSYRPTCNSCVSVSWW